MSLFFKDIEITLCVGLVGTCLVGLLNDEFDSVYHDISTTGVTEWYEALPEHDGPDEGVFTLVCNVKFYDSALSEYEINKVKVHEPIQ